MGNMQRNRAGPAPGQRTTESRSRTGAVPAAGARGEGSTTVTIPEGARTGNYYIIAKDDANNEREETKKGTNLYYWQILVGPGMATSTLPGPTTGGSTFTVTDATKNQGGGTA